uniref:Bestrophin homolog n=1 Tax=Ditylenchus dipsaci TaxID=166011 RepID=A0A915EHT8_9BILA
MTITYSLDVASATFVGIHKLLFRWKGSIWKSIYPEMLAWFTIYIVFSFTYRYVMNKEQRVIFENLCIFFKTYSDYIPITFMLGFYVTAVFGRWHDILNNLGWIDSPGLLLATHVRGSSEEARMIRRNIVRYMILVQAMVFRDITGLMTTAELKEFDSIPSPHIKYWTPIQWAFLLLRRAKDKNIIESDFIYVDMLESIRQFRLQVLTLTLYDWVPIPLVYTQVVNFAVRAYFIIALFGRQFLNISERDSIEKSTIDLYIPIMTLLQFIFYMGWMKVANVILNPLGEDDDDFETNWIIDRNLQVGFSIVDDCYGRVPELEKDVFWEETLPEPLYTPESANRPHNPMLGSCNDHASQEDALLMHPRRRRLMSTQSSNAFESSLMTNKEVDEEGASITQVENHNPQRRMSVSSQANDNTGHTGIIDTLKRKFSKTTSPHDLAGSVPELNHDKTLQPTNGRLSGSFSKSSGNRAAAPKSPLTQDNFKQATTNQRKCPDNLDVTVLDGEEDEENSSPNMNKFGNSNAWSVNEMLPIIEEVQERMRRNAKGSTTESLQSSISNSSSLNGSDTPSNFSRDRSPQNDSEPTNKDAQQKFLSNTHLQKNYECRSKQAGCRGKTEFSQHIS